MYTWLDCMRLPLAMTRTVFCRLDLGIKVDRRGDEIDVVLPNVGGQAVLFAGDVGCASVLVLEEVVASLEQALGLCDGGVDGQSATRIRQLCTLRGETFGLEPVSDGLDGVGAWKVSVRRATQGAVGDLRGLKGVANILRTPVLAVV